MSIFDKLAQILPGGKTSGNQDFFFGLNIEEKKVEASVWGFVGKKLTILSSSSGVYHNEDSLLEAGNIALDEALGDLPIDPEKILFGVPDSWLQDDDIRPEHLQKLRRMVKEWGLSPMAYVSTTQAITHFLQKQQGVPLTGILVRVEDPLQVAVVKAGKIMASKEHKRTDNLPEDIEKVLLSFSDIEVLPSKVLIFGEENFAKVKDELQSFPWMAQLPFLHLPKIEELSVNIQMAAICLAGASELNPGLNVHPADLGRLALALPKAESHLSHQLPEEKALPVHRGSENRRIGGSDGEFVAGDIQEMEHGKSKMVDEDDLGEWEEDENRGGKVRVDHGSAEAEGGIGMALSEMASNLTAPFKGGHEVGPHHEGAVTHHGGGGKASFFANRLIIFGVVVLMLLVGAYLLLPKAQVKVFIDLRVLEKDAEVIADPGVTAVDETAKKIPGKFVEADVSGSQKGSATGKKKIGESAKGSVLLYNKTSSPKSFPSGTILSGPNNLTFKLDNTVNVASQSAVDGGISFGKGSGNVTAEAIGPDGNLSAGTELGIKNESGGSYSAKVDQALSGGVSKDVTVVTADDQSKLLAALSSDLRSKAQEQIQGKLTGDMKILSQALTETITKQTFSKKVGDQTSDFSLDMTVHDRGTAYSDSDLKSIVSKLVDANVPSGYQLDLSQTETQADVSKVNKDGTIVFLAKFKAKLMPKFDVEQVKKKIAFKSKAEAQEELKKLENVIGSEIKITPVELPGALGRLPMLPQNISIEVTAK